MFGVLNEPRINFQGLTLNSVQKFYSDAYQLIRGITGVGNSTTPYLVYHDGFLGQSAWAGSMKGYERVVLGKSLCIVSSILYVTITNMFH